MVSIRDKAIKYYNLRYSEEPNPDYGEGLAEDLEMRFWDFMKGDITKKDLMNWLDTIFNK